MMLRYELMNRQGAKHAKVFLLVCLDAKGKERIRTKAKPSGGHLKE